MRPDPLTEERVREIVRKELSQALPRFLSVAEVADRLAVTKAHVYALLDQQAMESRYVGKRRIVRAESFAAYAESLPAFRDA
jgi:excisionase family DNA binding protein